MPACPGSLRGLTISAFQARAVRAGLSSTGNAMTSAPVKLTVACCGLLALLAVPAVASAQPSAHNSTAGRAASGHSSSATRAAAASWQLSADLPGQGGIGQLSDVVATRPDDAWAGGESGYLPLIEHWNGASWTNVSPTTARFHTRNDEVDAIGASSPSNVWGLVTSPTNGYAMRWNGSSWIKYGFRGYLIMYGVAVESRKNVWAFGMTGSYRPFVRHFNGSRWSYVAMPGVPQGVSALAWNDIYAMGPTTSSFCETCYGPARDTLMQWNGKSWRSLKFPSLNMNRKQVFAPIGIVATKTGGVWITGDVQHARNAQPLKHELLHWTGKRWQVFASPVSLGPVTSDGSGGLWMTDVSYNPGPPESFVHFSHGTFTLTTVPLPPTSAPSPEVGMSGIGLVPGTTSVWAVGFLAAYGFDSVIYRYGS